MATHEQLEAFLQSDPRNTRLLADAAAAAFDEGHAAAAARLLERHEAIEPLPPPLLNLRGLAALDLGRFEEAARAFDELLEQGHDEPEVRYNCAWAAVMSGEHGRALDLLDERVIERVPRSATLRITAMHRLGMLEEALAEGEAHAARLPDDEELMAALAAVALDAEHADVARSYAEKAGGSAEALPTLGFLALRENAPDALDVFERALAARPGNARAHLGKGLALLNREDFPEAARELDRAAILFDGHLGSWVAAGWAHFRQGDYATSRARFEAALERDGTFSEIHGGLAVLDIVEGKLDSARGRADVALRLDGRSLSGALAKSLLLAEDGRPEAAANVRERALSMPVGASGETLGQLMSTMTGGGPNLSR